MQKRFASTFVAFATLMSLGTGVVAHAFSVQTSATVNGGIEGSREQRDQEGANDRRPLLSRMGRSTTTPGEDRHSTTTPGMRKGEDHNRPGMRMMIGHNLRGVVTSVGINTIMVSAKQGSTTATFTVDVTGAKIFKDKSTTTLSAILVNDTVLVLGQVTGASVVATAVYDGKLPVIIQKMKEERQEIRKDDREDRKADRKIGSGIIGMVSAVSGNTISVIGRMGTTTATTTYAVDVTSATLFKDKATTTISSILIGDRVLVEGTVNGTSVTAVAVYDGKLPMSGKAFSAQAEAANGEGNGFMGKIGGFFKSLFRFGRDN